MRFRTITLIALTILMMSCGGHGRPPIPGTVRPIAVPVGANSTKHLASKTEDSKKAIKSELQRTDDVIEYLGYSVSYNKDRKIPNWVSYELLASETDGPYSRKGKNFRQDPSLRLPQAEDNDYRNSGWSRGHMAPAGDFKWSDDAMWDTFYFTNCCPQNQSLNAGQWNTLEQKVRDWAKMFGKVYVVTGPIIGKNIYGTIGNNRVVVPDAFFKAVLANDQTIAFVMHNHNNNENMQKCAMSVDDLEALTGIDFFSELDDNFENQVEAIYNLRTWNL
jgi:endonuclease G